MANYNRAIVEPLGDPSPGNPMPVTTYLTSSGSATITVTTAGTSIVLGSFSANAIYLTGFMVNNGATAGWALLGYGSGVVAPTTSAIICQNMFMAINGNIPFCEIQPIKIPASNNLLITATSCTTLSITVTYYVAP